MLHCALDVCLHFFYPFFIRDPVIAGKSAQSVKDSGNKTPAVPSHLQKLTAKPLGKQEETVCTYII